MDVDRPIRCHCRDGIELVQRDGAQAVWRDADNGLFQPRDAFAAFLKQAPELPDMVDESPLAFVGRCAAKGGMGIEDWQQRQPDSSVPGRGGYALGHLGDIGVRLSVAVVMEIVELADAGEAGFKHLDIELRRDRLDLVRRHRQRVAVHHLAPAPETVG